MAIKKYIPKETQNIPSSKQIIDRRKPEGGYYHAKCDFCGGEFFPSRKTSKYCSRICTQRMWRKMKLQKKPRIKEAELSFRGMGKLVSYIKENYPKEIRGRIIPLRNWMRDADPFETLEYNTFKLTKTAFSQFIISRFMA